MRSQMQATLISVPDGLHEMEGNASRVLQIATYATGPITDQRPTWQPLDLSTSMAHSSSHCPTAWPLTTSWYWGDTPARAACCLGHWPRARRSSVVCTRRCSSMVSSPLVMAMR